MGDIFPLIVVDAQVANSYTQTHKYGGLSCAIDLYKS